MFDVSSSVAIETLRELAQNILDKRTHFGAKLRNDSPLLNILRVGTSAGGAKPKAVVAYNRVTGEWRSGQVAAPEGFDYYLLKFDGVGDSKIGDNPLGIGRIEYAYHLMAREARIIVPEAELFCESDKAHFMIKRFDRFPDGRKFFVQTLAALGHLDRDIPQSYESAFRIMRALGLSNADFDEMYRRMVFNVMARNHDDHTKNHAFIMSPEGRWRLAPAYDIIYSNSPSSRWTSQHQMSINGKRSDFLHSDLIRTAENCDIRHATKIIEEVKEAISHWRQHAKAARVSKHFTSHIAADLLTKL